MDPQLAVLFEEVVDPVGGRNLMEKNTPGVGGGGQWELEVLQAAPFPAYSLCFLLHQNEERALRGSSSVFRNGSYYSCYHIFPSINSCDKTPVQNSIQGGKSLVHDSRCQAITSGTS